MKQNLIIMKNISIILLLIISITGFSQNKDSDCLNYIEVTGSSEMSIIPNEIFLSIKLKEKEGKNEKSISELEVILKNILKKLEIPPENLSISDASSKYTDYWLNFKDDILISKNYILKLTDIEKFNQLYKELKNNNISNVYISKTNHSDIQKYRKEVKINALKAAKEKADYLLTSVDQELGKLIYVKEISDNEVLTKRFYGSNTISYSNSYSNNATAISLDDLKTTSNFKKIKLRYEIITRFEIK